MNTEKFSAGILLVHDFLSAAECAAQIAASEAMEYENALVNSRDGALLQAERRNNARVLFDDAALSAAMYARAASVLPAQDIDGWRVCGLNERWRYYRSGPGQFFRLHRDGNYQRSAQQESRYTFLLYLNDDFDGGDTDFIFEKVAARRGALLLFPHHLIHQGCAVHSGVKYVLRTDVMYCAG